MEAKQNSSPDDVVDERPYDDDVGETLLETFQNDHSNVGTTSREDEQGASSNMMVTSPHT